MLTTNNKMPPPPANRLGDMPVGTLLADYGTAYNGETIVWKIADVNHDGYPADSVTIMAHKLHAIAAFDAMEPRNLDGKCATIGCGRFIWSNLRQWINSSAPEGEWYEPKHEFDEPPDKEKVSNANSTYTGKAGFMRDFSASFKEAIMPTDLTVLIPDPYGEGFDEFTDKLFFPSAAEIGLVNYKKIDEGTKLAIFTDNASRAVYPTEKLVNSSDYKHVNLSASLAYFWWLRSPYGRDHSATYICSATGSALPNSAYISVNGVRPFCNLPSKTRVSLTANADGVYSLFA